MIRSNMQTKWKRNVYKGNGTSAKEVKIPLAGTCVGNGTMTLPSWQSGLVNFWQMGLEGTPRGSLVQNRTGCFDIGQRGPRQSYYHISTSSLPEPRPSDFCPPLHTSPPPTSGAVTRSPVTPEFLKGPFPGIEALAPSETFCTVS